jgi:hypothetical protein
MESFKKETITIYKEYEKISLLEYYLDNETSLESTVSNLIDYYIDKKYNLAQEYFKILKTKITDSNLFYKIIKISLSIANQKPLTIELDDIFKIYSKL